MQALLGTKDIEARERLLSLIVQSSWRHKVRRAEWIQIGWCESPEKGEITLSSEGV